MNSFAASLFCPAMKVTRKSWQEFITAVEAMTLNLVGTDVPFQVLPNIVIPQTSVRREHAWKWMVDACTGSGVDTAGNSFDTNLPPEEVIFDLLGMCMSAKAMDAPSRLHLADGRVFAGIMHFPYCKTDMFTGVADAVTATGTLTQIDG